MDYALINGYVVTPQNEFLGAVVVRGGKIKKVFAMDLDERDLHGSDKFLGYGAILKGFKGEIIDLAGKYIMPGVVDVHVHMRTPGETKKEDWLSGSRAALAGGVTTVLDMPNNKPAITSVGLLAKKRLLVAKKALVNYGFYVAATDDNVNEIVRMKGKYPVKVYLGVSTGGLVLKDKKKLEELFSKCARSTLFAIHAEDQSCLEENAKKFEGDLEPSVHGLVRPAECAFLAVKEVLHLAKKYDARVHICHVTTAKEVAIIKKFKTEKVTCEVTPHHLFLNDHDYDVYGNLIKVNPPVRGLADVVALWEGLHDGTIDMIATDHAPHLLEEKSGNYKNVPSGMPGVQTALMLMLNAVNDEKIPLSKVSELMSINPALAFGLKKKGEIKVGYDADLVIVDLDLAVKVCHKYLWSKANWSPFHGLVLKGWPMATFVNGNLMYKFRESFGKVKGKEVKF